MPRATSLRSPRLAVACVLLGLLVGVASYNLTAANTPRSQARADLIAQIEDRRTQVDALTAKASALQAEVTALEAAQLGGDQLAARSRDLAATVGPCPLEGRASRSPSTTRPVPGPTTRARRRRRGLAGQGHRQGPPVRHQRAVGGRGRGDQHQRQAADVHVVDPVRRVRDHRRLPAADPPLRHHRPGRPAALPSGVRRRPGGTYLSTLRSSFGVRVDTEVKKDLTVPAAVGLTTRYARTGDTGAATPSPSPPASPSHPRGARRDPGHRSGHRHHHRPAPAARGAGLAPALPADRRHRGPRRGVRWRCGRSSTGSSTTRSSSSRSSPTSSSRRSSSSSATSSGSAPSSPPVSSSSSGVRIFSNVAAIRRHLFDA